MGGKVIYTCITSCYDVLSQPSVIATDYDYVCFADQATASAMGVRYGEKSGVWEIRPIPFTSKDKLALSRHPKLQPHKVLPEYEWSLWVDANIGMEGDGLYREADRCITAGSIVAQVKHPFRDCVYQEMTELERQERLSMRAMLKESLRLRKAGFPHGEGQYENNLILRRHMDTRVINLSDLWWQEFLEFPLRDQVSLMFVYWREGFKPDLLLPEGTDARNAGYLTLHKHPSEPAKKHGLVISLKRAAKLPLRPLIRHLI